jgi:hypothetical protein
VDGKVWSWYCSRRCSTKAVGEANLGRAQTANAVRANRVRRERRVLHRVLAACKTMMDSQQRIPAVAVAKYLMQEYRRYYSIGYKAGQRASAPTTAPTLEEWAWSQRGTSEPSAVALDN